MTHTYDARNIDRQDRIQIYSLFAWVSSILRRKPISTRCPCSTDATQVRRCWWSCLVATRRCPVDTHRPSRACTWCSRPMVLSLTAALWPRMLQHQVKTSSAYQQPSSVVLRGKSSQRGFCLKYQHQLIDENYLRFACNARWLDQCCLFSGPHFV